MTTTTDIAQTLTETAEASAGSGVELSDLEYGKCWTLEAVSDNYGSPYYYNEQHFPTRAAAIEAWSQARERTDSQLVVRWVTCDEPDCLEKHTVAWVAAVGRQAAAAQAAAVQDRHDDEAAYRTDRLRLATAAAEQAQQYYARRLELEQAEAERRQRELELRDDEADQREEALQLARDQHQAQAEAQLEQARVELARRLVDHAGAEIGKADAKAGFVVTVELALIGAVGAGTLGAGGVLRWVAIAALLIGVVTAAWAVVPRMPRAGEARQGLALNFGAIRDLGGAELAEQLGDVDELAATSQEAVNLARIAHAKYRAVRWAVRAGVAGLVLAIAAAVVGGW